MISEVQLESLDWVWDELRSEIEVALSHGQGDGTTPAIMREAVRTGRMKMWCMHEGEKIIAGIVLSVSNYPSSIRKLYVQMLVGTGMDDWGEELLKLLIDYRDLVGANVIEASCRPGLARRLERDWGWHKKAVIMEI